VTDISDERKSNNIKDAKRSAFSGCYATLTIIDLDIRLFRQNN